jgi:hypothetical protein
LRLTLSRSFLGLAAAILLAGAWMHTSAFHRVAEAAAISNLEAFFAHSLPALWLIDSAVMTVLALLFAAVAFRPAMAAPPVVLILGLIPGATAYFLYRFIGSSFIPAHMLAFAAALTLTSAALRFRAGASDA